MVNAMDQRKLDIKIRKQSMVPPIEPTPSCTVWISSVDLIIPRIHVQTVYFYPNDGSSDFFQHEKLAEALGKTLVPFYPVAGRLKRGEGGRIEINCNAEGALLVEAEADAEIADFRKFSGFQQLVPYVEDDAQDITSYPILVLQVTFFKCGGVSLGVGMQHQVADGMSGIHFINTWAEMARGIPITVKPFLDRTLLKPRSPPTPKFPHIEYQPPPRLVKAEKVNGAVNGSTANGNGTSNGAHHATHGNGASNGAHGANGHHHEIGANGLRNENGNGVSNGHGALNGDHQASGKGATNGAHLSNGAADGEDLPMAVRVFKFTKEQLASLKRMATVAKTTVTYSSYEMLSGHIWKCVTQARKLADSQEIKLFVAADGRSRLNPPLPKGYFGNVIFTTTPMITAGELVANPLTFGASKIHDAVARMDDEYLRSALDYLESQEDMTKLMRGAHHFNSPNLAITSWARMPVYDCDFGWGRPIYMGPAAIVYEGLAYVLASPTGDGSLSLSLGLRADHMATFETLVTAI